MIRLFATALSFAVFFSFSIQSALFAGDAKSSSDSALTLWEAREYMLSLINRDRASAGLAPVKLNALAEKAGQNHSDDMALAGYLSHWDSQGRKPDQRYTETGGRDFVMENCHLEFSGYAEDDSSTSKKEATLIESPRFEKRTLEKIEAGFFNEQPPNDGHRKNILDPHHNGVGIGLSIARLGQSERLACTQEFVNSYIELKDLPAKVSRGGSVVIQGRVPEGLRLHGIDAYWESSPQPMTLKELEATTSYGPPAERIKSFFPAPCSVSPAIEVRQNGSGEEFSLTVPVEKEVWKSGLCYLYIWVRKDSAVNKEVFLASSQTLVIE